jgi:hypothetical protein
MKPLNRKLSLVIFILLLAIPIQTVRDTYESAAINDELYYAVFGYVIFKTGNFDLQPFPNLVSEIAALPLLLINPLLPLDHESWATKKINPFSRQFFFHSGNDPVQILFWSRVMMIIVSVLLAFYVFKWSRELYGNKAALLALFLYVFNVQILSHSNRVLLELTLSFFIFLSVYYFWRYINQPTKKNITIVGITFGLALASKVTAILLVPIFFVISTFVVMYKKKIKSSFTMPLTKYFSKKPIIKKSYFLLASLIIIIVIGLFALELTYGAQLKPLKMGDKEINMLNKMVSDSSLRSMILSTIGFIDNIPIPLADYIESLGFQFIHSRAGHGRFFLMGNYSTKGWWYYFLTSLFFKLQVPLIILLIATILLYKKIRHKQPLNEVFIMVTPLVFLLFFSFISHLNMGINYLIPIFPFLFVFVSKIINARFSKQWLFYLLLSLLGIWYMASAIAISPYYSAYFNEFAGGPENGHNIIVDYDCGQHLPKLKEYLDKNNIAKIKWVYTGSVEPDYYGIPYENLYHPVLLEYWKEEPLNYSKTCTPGKGVYVLPARVLQNFGPDQHCFDWLKNKKPVAKIGYCFFVYDVPE